MLRRSRVLLAVAMLAAVAVGVAATRHHDGGTVAGAATTTTGLVTTTSAPSSTASSTSTTSAPLAPRLPWAPVPSGPGTAVVSPSGVVMAVLRTNPDGSVVAEAPCGGETTVRGTLLSGANVVLDPGHGGEETGAVGPGGTMEKTVNLAVAEDTKRQLEAAGATVVLTRSADYRVTLASRRAIVNALHPQLFLSIHHNADPDGPHVGPGGETYFQIASPASKRAAGLVYATVRDAFASQSIAWAGDTDAGAKYRLRSDGTDYYGILHGVDVPAVLSEAAYITNPPEEALLATAGFQHLEAQALTSAIERDLFTDEPGSGFTTPYPRTEPAGSGGGSTGCVDPALR